MEIQEIKINDNFYYTVSNLSNKNFPNTESFSIFNQAAFLNLHKDLNISIFHLYKSNKNQCLGVINFLSEEDYFQSPCIGSYGGFEFKDGIDYEIKHKFIESTINFIRLKKIKKIKIKVAPQIYNKNENAEINSILHNLGFQIKHSDLNQYIDINNYSIDKSVSYGNRKRIKNCSTLNFKFSQLTNDQYFSAFKIISDNRKRRGYPLTMNWSGISEMVKVFNKKILFFGLIDNEKIIASAICINVLKSILYVFYWGETGGYENLSPVAYLSNKIVNYSKSNDFKILDVGISSVSSKVNSGLFKFKQNIGCDVCNKFIYEKSFS